MSAYRSLAQSGRLIARCEDSGGQWCIGALIATFGALGMALHANHLGSGRLDPESMATIVFVGIAGLCVLESRRLRGEALELYEDGLVVMRNREHTWLPWPAIHEVKALYIRGPNGRGIADRSNLVSLILRTSHGTIVNLSNENAALTALENQLRTHSQAPIESALI